ncbi:MAG TPA: alpha-1,4-glucan--maltose-1-phosphate maltosyltransferase, partial [Clostridia bacterium]|nr:alpha-1,4-glucan--maltose-1-phosphate maltosyltransferase [Clostridia bacterium]
MSEVPDGRRRVIIEGVSPEIDGGRFPIKRVPGEKVVVEADIYADGHDVLAAALLFRREGEEEWSEVPMKALVNDRWRGKFTVEEVGTYEYTIEAWVNQFRTWRRNLEKKFAARMDVALELLTGREFIQAVQKRAEGQDRRELESVAESLSPENPLPDSAKVLTVLNERIVELMDEYLERKHSVRYARKLRVQVDPLPARFSAWYEFFPRSCAPEPGRHGTFKDCEAMLARVARMGFDTVYFPPIHPIGTTYRKGRNNSLIVEPGDPGSPWAIGSEEGGHKAVNPALGTLEDFQALVAKARKLGLQIALDIAFQCSPDHPYVKEHPEWFRHRPDGSIQYAENPPKKYQDIYPLDFESEDWRGLWIELKSIFEFWIEQGVRVFRVDNPHTKPFRFWTWCLGGLKREHPDLIFLSEAFTRPKVMYQLAKLGFTQSYNYFPWRNTKHEIQTYLEELTQTEVQEFFRPNLWPNTPDILTQNLQYGGRPVFVSRLILAATLGASYGIYGPPYEICENTPREPGSEEYLNSEKYEVRHWDLAVPGGLGDLMAHLNQIRRENPALQSNERLCFHDVDNEQILVYSKHTEDLENIILVMV